MRRKRSARKKKMMKKKALYQTASLLSIAAFGIAQVTPTSHALFSYSASIKDGQITSSFVFPETIEGLVNEIKAEMEQIETLKEQADSVYEKLQLAESSEQAISENNLDEILEAAKASQEIASNKVNELNIYLEQGQLEVIVDESATKILIIIEDGLETATELMDTITMLINEMEGMLNEANVTITAMIQVETALLEKEIIAEIAKKALEGVTTANGSAEDILVRYGANFDLDAFQSLVEALTNSETDIQKALKDADKYLHELKAYVDGTKETASPDVVAEAKANYEKVQQAIDHLKETMENTKTTNSEVQSRIEQEKQRQEEEAKRIELEEEAKRTQQELENQEPPAGGGGVSEPQEQPSAEDDAPNLDAPATEGEEPNSEAPPQSEEEPKENPQDNVEIPDQQTPEKEANENNPKDGDPMTNQPTRPNDADSIPNNQDGDDNPSNAGKDNGAPSNHEDTAETTESSDTSNDNSENNSSTSNETQSAEPSSDSESVSRDTVASLNTSTRETEFFSIDRFIVNRRDEEDETEQIMETDEIGKQNIQTDILTIDNKNKLIINIRSYLWSQWNKKL
ncbi:MAG TPA: hypothetical protein GX497_17000 [Bacillus bacterium]|nr:hypothetical protein [Bacillus sp. (in: firmicutes)]